MRGPGMRIEQDMRREWACPQCGASRWLGAEVTSMTCPCQPAAVMMQLVRDSRPHRPVAAIAKQFVTYRLSQPEDAITAAPADESAATAVLDREAGTAALAEAETSATGPDVAAIEHAAVEHIPDPVEPQRSDDTSSPDTPSADEELPWPAE